MNPYWHLCPADTKGRLVPLFNDFKASGVEISRGRLLEDHEKGSPSTLLLLSHATKSTFDQRLNSLVPSSSPDEDVLPLIARGLILGLLESRRRLLPPFLSRSDGAHLVNPQLQFSMFLGFPSPRDSLEGYVGLRTEYWALRYCTASSTHFSPFPGSFLQINDRPDDSTFFLRDESVEISLVAFPFEDYEPNPLHPFLRKSPNLAISPPSPNRWVVQ